MKFINFDNAFLKNKEKIESPKLSELDVKGREISGLLPKPEKFSTLEKDVDYKIIAENNQIEANVKLDDQFIFINPTKGENTKIVEAPHWRSISSDDIQATYKKDEKTEYFYTSNTKGIGYLKPTLKGDKSIDEYSDWNRIDEAKNRNAYGIASENSFFVDGINLIDRTKSFIDSGLRTELFWGIADLDYVYYKGERTSISKLRELGVIPKGKSYRPQMGVRLMKMNNRVAEVKDSETERTKEIFNKAFEVFNKETEDSKLNLPKIIIGDIESEKIYFHEFFKRMAENMAVLQNIDYLGLQIHSANVTLAAEIVDTGGYLPKSSFGKNEEMLKKYAGVERGVLKDMRDIAYDLKFLLSAGEKIGVNFESRNELVGEYLKAFDEKLDIKKYNEESLKDIKNAIGIITKAVLVENKNLSALKHGGKIEDWGILA